MSESRRHAYRMAEDEYSGLLKASESVPYIVVGGMGPISPQERANTWWQGLAKTHHFIWDSVRPHGSDPRSFTAMPLPHVDLKTESEGVPLGATPVDPAA